MVKRLKEEAREKKGGTAKQSQFITYTHTIILDNNNLTRAFKYLHVTLSALHFDTLILYHTGTSYRPRVPSTTDSSLSFFLYVY